MEADPRPPVQPRVRSAPPPPREIPTARIVIATICFAVLLVVSMYGFHRYEQFLIRDARFALNGPDGSWDTATLEIAGASHASVGAVEAVFSADAGQSVYLLPLNDRRASLRAVNWVRDASIQRMWPNRVIVQIAERVPVAYIMIAPAHSGLIDEDGVILPPTPEKFRLPLLIGVRPTDAIEDRHRRVQKMMRLMNDLGKDSGKISQVDISDPDNLKIMLPWDGRKLTLLMGDHAYAQRYANFVGNYSEIKKRVPGASTLDVRLEDRITAVE